MGSVHIYGQGKIMCHRKTATKVKNGQVQRKNNWEQSPNMFTTYQNEILVDRERAGKAYRHLLRKQDLYDFFELIPDWAEVSKGLDGVFLGRGDVDYLGCYHNQVITLTAWDRELFWFQATESFVEDHRSVLEGLNVPISKIKSNCFRLDFDEASAKAFQLVHVFMHELGHHVDRMTSKQRRFCGRGENFAEFWARQHEKEMLSRYLALNRL